MSAKTYSEAWAYFSELGPDASKEIAEAFVCRLFGVLQVKEHITREEFLAQLESAIFKFNNTKE